MEGHSEKYSTLVDTWLARWLLFYGNSTFRKFNFQATPLSGKLKFHGVSTWMKTPLLWWLYLKVTPTLSQWRHSHNIPTWMMSPLWWVTEHCIYSNNSTLVVVPFQSDSAHTMTDLLWWITLVIIWTFMKSQVLMVTPPCLKIKAQLWMKTAIHLGYFISPGNLPSMVAHIETLIKRHGTEILGNFQTN